MFASPALRLPRFARAPESLGLSLTDRDRTILRAISRFRFLNSEQIVRLLDGSPQPILRRLQKLYHHGYVDRPRAQIDYFHRGGSKPLIYGLGRKGSMEVFPEGDQRPRFDNLHVGKLHLQHTLEIAEVLIGVELACRRRPGFRFIPESELLRDEQSFHWAVTVQHGGTTKRVGLIPDGVFALEDARGERAYYFLEADRGTMPVQRESLSQSSFFRKMLAYEATWTRCLHQSRFGFHRFRVVTVTSSAKRIASLIEACGQLPRGQGLFLFIDATSFRTSDPLEQRWFTGHKGQVDGLFD